MSVTPVFLRWIAMRRFSPLLVMGGVLLGGAAADAQGIVELNGEDRRVAAKQEG